MVKNITSMYLADKAKCFSHIIVTPNIVLCPHQWWCWHQWYQGGTKANVPVLVSGVDNGTDHGTDHGTGAGINPPLITTSSISGWALAVRGCGRRSKQKIWTMMP